MRIGRRNFLAGLPAVGAAADREGRAGSGATSLRQRLREASDKTALFDSHEHFWDEPQRLSGPLDFFSLVSDYVISDVTSAGMPAEAARVVRDPHAPDADRWHAFEPYWKNARFTGYSRALRLAVRDLYGVEEISPATLPKINRALRESNQAGVYRRLVKERSGIRACVQDDYWNAVPARPANDFLLLARRFDRFVVPSGPSDIAQLEKLTDVSITSLDTLQKALESNFQRNVDAGMITVKVGLAYMRELLFNEVAEEDAARDFERLAKAADKPAEGFRNNFVRRHRAFEDYMFHHVMQLADAHQVPVQIHTGIHAGNRGVVTNTRPTLLTNVFLLYPRLRFDLFHIGYPYEDELAALVKSFPNVYADFCWAHVISPEVARRTLSEFLDSVPVNKIFGFGGDYHYPELSYAHARMARQNIADVLAQKTEERIFTETEALEIGRMLLHDNAAAFFTKSGGPPA